MKKIVGVRFKEAGKLYYFNPGDLEIKRNEFVMVETARGLEMGEVLVPPRDVPEDEIVAPLKDVLRKADQRDHETARENAKLEREAHDVCQAKIQERELNMKLVDVEYTFDRSKILFYFTADGRVDFRELVKDLAAQFKTRIELRQIGVRDEAKMLGGLGCCGRPVCCKTFLGEFQPVSIKMAKEQNLSLSPTKISGLCGRLMCCLKYEQSTYECLRKQMPKVGREIMTPDGIGMVVENNVISEKSRVRLTLEDGTNDMREYSFHNLVKPTQEDFDKHQIKQEEAAAVKAERDAARALRAERVAARRHLTAKPQKQSLEAFEADRERSPGQAKLGPQEGRPAQPRQQQPRQPQPADPKPQTPQQGQPQSQPQSQRPPGSSNRRRSRRRRKPGGNEAPPTKTD